MSISLVSTTTGTNSTSAITTQVGDLVIFAAYRNTTGTPSLPAGKTSILTKTGTTSSMRVGYVIATGTSTASGTWTNATAMVAHVYRSSQYASGGSVFPGASASNSATTNTVNYPALTLFHTDNTSWVAGFAGTSNTSQTIATAPSGMTNESHETASATQCAGHDTEGTVTSWSSTNATTTGTAGDSVSATVEIVENQPGTYVSNIVQHWSYGYDNFSNGDKQENLTFNIDPTLSGNGLVCVVSYFNGATPQVSDNKSNTWPTAGTTNAPTIAGSNCSITAFVLASATTGTSQVVVGFGGNPQAPVKVWITQLYNITGTVNGSASAGGVNSGGVVSPGTYTPTNNNANGGNLILSWICADGNDVTSPSMFAPETNFALNDADISYAGTNVSFPNASQFHIQATAAAITPRFYVGGTVTYNAISLALSVGTQGTAPPTNNPGGAPWINRVCYFQVGSTPNPWIFQAPGSGNMAVVTSFVNASGSSITSSGITDNDAGTWTLYNTNTGPSIFHRDNITSARSNRTLSMATAGGSGNNCQALYYDIANAATSSPVVATATASLSASSGANQPDITPTAANQLTIAFTAVGTGPTVALTSPSGANFDTPLYDVAKFVAGITTTTMTVASTTWGAIDAGSGSGIIEGTGVSTGTFASSGSGPYTVTPSQSVSSGTTMLQTCQDNNALNFGNGTGHYFNVSSTSQQNWTWTLPSGLGCQGAAIIIAGQAAAGSVGTIAGAATVSAIAGFNASVTGAASLNAVAGFIGSIAGQAVASGVAGGGSIATISAAATVDAIAGFAATAAGSATVSALSGSIGTIAGQASAPGVSPSLATVSGVATVDAIAGFIAGIQGVAVATGVPLGGSLATIAGQASANAIAGFIGSIAGQATLAGNGGVIATIAGQATVSALSGSIGTIAGAATVSGVPSYEGLIFGAATASGVAGFIGSIAGIAVANGASPVLGSIGTIAAFATLAGVSSSFGPLAGFPTSDLDPGVMQTLAYTPLQTLLYDFGDTEDFYVSVISPQATLFRVSPQFAAQWFAINSGQGIRTVYNPFPYNPTGRLSPIV